MFNKQHKKIKHLKSVNESEFCGFRQQQWCLAGLSLFPRIQRPFRSHSQMYYGEGQHLHSGCSHQTISMDQWKQTVLLEAVVAMETNHLHPCYKDVIGFSNGNPQDPLPLGGSTSTASLRQWLSTISILSEVSCGPGPSRAHSLCYTTLAWSFLQNSSQTFLSAPEQDLGMSSSSNRSLCV